VRTCITATLWKLTFHSKFWTSHRGIDEEFHLNGYYTVQIVLKVPTFKECFLSTFLTVQPEWNLHNLLLFAKLLMQLIRKVVNTVYGYFCNLISCYLNKQIRGNKQHDIHMHSLIFKKVGKYQYYSRELHAVIIPLI